MRNLLYEMLKKLVDKVSLNGPAFEENRLCNNLNLMIEGLDASKMVNEIGDKVAFLSQKQQAITCFFDIINEKKWIFIRK